MTLHRDEPSTASARQPEGTADPAAPVDEAVLVDEFATDDVAPHDEAGNPVLDKVVFGVAAAIVLAFIAWGVFATDNLSAVAKSVLGGIITGGGWAFVLAASGFVIFAVWLAVSRYGRIPLGRDDEAPEFRTSS
jgi:hypothetical protein